MLVSAILIYLIATAASNTSMYYLTVEEALAKGSSLNGSWVRVAGAVPGDSINWESENFELTFDVVEGEHSVPAVYQGVRPDNLVDGSNVVLEGTFRPDGVFEVDQLLVQCVSKYEAGGQELDPDKEYQEIDGVLYEVHDMGGFGGF